MPTPLPADPVRRTATDAFSYACHRCRRCCHGKAIQVNPYEIARLARNRGLGTTEFIARFLDDGQPYLRRDPVHDACVFLGPEGCTVHGDRPLVCRVYPLGRHVRGDGRVEFSVLEGHPESAGVFGQAGTIADYLAGQGIDDFTATADRYLTALQRLFDSWRASPPAAAAGDAANEAEPPELLDLDRAVAAHCAHTGTPEPAELDARVTLHLAAIEAWLARHGPPAGG